jgi:hypothetical protein
MEKESGRRRVVEGEREREREESERRYLFRIRTDHVSLRETASSYLRAIQSVHYYQEEEEEESVYE